MTRRLTEDEHVLWERLRQTVKPLKHSRKTTRATATPTAPPAAREKPIPKAERAQAAPAGKAESTAFARAF